MYIIGLYSTTDVFGQQSNQIRRKRKIRAITPFKVIQGRYQSKARMQLPISDWQLVTDN